jgi:Carboxypeptidase regulatory-like domain
MKISRTRVIPIAALAILAAALLSLAAPGPARGEEPANAGPGRQRVGKISGTVTDPMHRALAGLLVKLESRVEPGMLRVTCTDLKGQYHFKELPTGVYDVRVEADGFGPGSKERIDVRPPFQNIVDVVLTRAAAGPAVVPAPAAPGTGPAGSNDAGPAGGSGTNEAPVVVRGRFVTPEGQPELEVSVLLVRADGGRLYQTFSSDDGTFAIPDVAPGRYRVLVRSAGHVTIDLKSVDVRPVDGLRLSLALVDFPLNTRQRGSRPQEMPRPLPAALFASPGTAPAPAPAPPGRSPAAPEDPGAPPDDSRPAEEGAPES